MQKQDVNLDRRCDSCCLAARQKRREAELRRIPKWRKFWKILQKKDAQLDEKERAKLDFQRRFLYNLIQKFLKILDSTPDEGGFTLYFNKSRYAICNNNNYYWDF